MAIEVVPETPEAFLARHQRRDRRRSLVWGAAGLTVVALCAGWMAHGEVVRSWLRGETDLDGRYVYAPSHPVDRDALASLDMERIHARLIPGWVIAHARARREADTAGAEAELRWQELRAAVAPDANLAALLDELHDHVCTDPLGRRHRIDWLVWAWDRYLDDQGIPYRLEASLHLLPRGIVFSTRSYHVLSDVRWRDQQRPLRARLLARVDPTNVVEAHLGHSRDAEEGALIVLDRVLSFSTREVWPLLDPALDPRLDRLERAFAPAIRAEAARSLSMRDLALLRSSAVDSQAMVEISDAVHARHACGSRYVMRDLPWNGLTPWKRRTLLAALRRSEGNEGCPEIRRDEAATILGASERLAVTRGLPDAVEAMVGWVSRAIARHEIRHVADDHPDAPVCRGCPPELSDAEASEVHAYLASFADEETGTVALLQACNLGTRNLGANELAFGWVSHRLMLDGCLEGPPPDLAARSRKLLHDLFGDGSTVNLSANFPRSVRFLPRDLHNLVGSVEVP